MSEHIDHKFTQIASVKKLTESSATLLLPDKQELQWPRSLLPTTVKVNDSIRILIHDKESEAEERKQLAKTLLNEVMSSTKK